VRIENEELQKQAMKHQIMTYEGERDNISNKLINSSVADDQQSVCSCNCMGTSSENGQLIDGYLPTDLITSSLSLKRASV
jgi:hypothetical protein